jgi:xanthine dehydrogenase accessory factor
MRSQARATPGARSSKGLAMTAPPASASHASGTLPPAQALAADHDAIPETALGWHRAGRGAALATVIETWGSAPRQAGSQLAVSGDGQIMGSVSGGCVEGAVVTEALESLADGRPRLLTFGVADETAFAVGLACGGTIRVLVEPVGPGPEALSPDLLEALVVARARHHSLALVIRPEGWSRSLVSAAEDAAVAARLRADRSGMEADGRFIAVHNAPLRLIVVGAVHIAQPLLQIARSCGYAPSLIDPRETFGSAARFPGETILSDWPDEAMAALAPDGRTAVVTLTHDPKLDDPAITAALASPAFYLGCLGSPRTHARRLERLRAAGLDEAALGRIHAPVGLDIGARTPAEIAVAVMAEITRALRQGR